MTAGKVFDMVSYARAEKFASRRIMASASKRRAISSISDERY